MRYTAAILLTCLLATGAVACAKSYDEIVTDCATALKERPEGDKSKPDACKDVKEDDYIDLLVSQNINDLGWTDDEGNFDKNKMLEDVQR